MSSSRSKVLFVSLLIVLSISSYITLEHIEYFSQSNSLQFQQSDLSLKFSLISGVLETVTDLITDSFMN